METELWNGLKVFTLLGLYFVILDILGYSNVEFLKMGNAFFLLGGMNKAIQEKIAEGKHDYFEKVKAALGTAVIGVGLSIIGLMAYLSFMVTPDQMNDLASPLISFGAKSSTVTFVIAMLFEGMASSVILTFIIMQYYKNVKSLNKMNA